MSITDPFWLVLAIPLAMSLWLWRLPSRLMFTLRCLSMALLVFALCGLCVRMPVRSGTVVVVADRSLSMPPRGDATAKEAADLVFSTIGGGDKLAVVSFAEKAAVEQSPQAAKLGGFSADVGREASHLADALDLGLSLIGRDEPGRILVVSDGRWTGRDLTSFTARAAATGVAVDYRLVERSSAGDLAVEHIRGPESVLPGESFMISAWIESPLAQPVSYELIGGSQVIAQGTQKVPPGRSRLLFRDTASRRGVREYTLRIQGEGTDPVPENNRARLLVGVRGARPILCVSQTGKSGLADLLTRSGLKVESRSAAQCDWSLEQLAGYSAVLLENQPAGQIGHVGLQNLAAWVSQSGGGMMCTGGKDSYGPGGYYKSPLEPIMPVSMELRREHRKFSLAIVVALDRSGSMAMTVGDLIRARNIGLDILRYYPSSPELHHRTALAAARSGDAKGALDLLTRSGLPLEDLSALDDAVRKARRNPFLPMDRILAEPFIDEGFGEDEPEPARVRGAQWEAQLIEDLAALHARLLKERVFETARQDGRRKRALAAFEAYHRLYTAKQGYYPGINAATMALCAGDTGAARKIAALLTATLSPESEDYWPLATLAEALLIVDRGGDAKDVLLRARNAHGADDGAKASTVLQFRRIGTVIDTNLDVLIDALRPRNVAVISGHMFRGTELDATAQAETEATIRARAEELFAAHNVGFVYGALACGSDIILAETALRMGAEFEAVLPFNTERFIETSVRIGDPPGEPGKWEKRFRAILDGTHGPCALTIMEPQDPIERDIDGYFFYGFRYAAGCALQRAAMLQTACGLIAVSDDTESDSVAGANRVLADWRMRGRPFDLIAYPHKRPPRPARARGKTAFRPVVFLWDGAPEAKDFEPRQAVQEDRQRLGYRRAHPSRRAARRVSRHRDHGGRDGDGPSGHRGSAQSEASFARDLRFRPRTRHKPQAR